jgi:hypothetical protein
VHTNRGCPGARALKWQVRVLIVGPVRLTANWPYDEEIAGGVTFKFAGNTACFLYPAAKTVNGIATGGGAKAAWR